MIFIFPYLFTNWDFEKGRGLELPIAPAFANFKLYTGNLIYLFL